MSNAVSRFTLIDAIVLGVVGLIVVVFVFLGLSSMLFRSHGHPRYMQSNTQIRGIHQSMVMYAQSNNNWFPGFDRFGDVLDASVEYRYQVLLENNFFTGEYMMSPSEDKTEWTTGPVTSANYSFAMLDINAPGERAMEWRETLNTEAALMSDRNTGRDARDHVSSVHTDTDSGDWRGSVAWGDNHTAFSTTHLLDTKYGQGPSITGDNLFEDPDDSTAGSNAYMIYSGD